MSLADRKLVPALPEHWIGIDQAWATEGKNPLDYLVSVPPSDLSTHALIIGATGSGKTNLLHHLIAQDIKLGHSFCVLDLRGDLVAAVLELCAGRIPPEKIKIIDLREKHRAFGFNPLHGSGEPYFRALNVLDVVAEESDGLGPQWGEYLRMGLLLLAETSEPLTQLEAVFYNRDFRNQCLSRCESEQVIGFWQRYDELSDEKQNTLATPVMNKVSLLLATKTIRQILGHRTPFDLAAHLNTPGSILLVSLAVDEMHAAGRMMGSLVLSAICREIFARVSTPESARNPVRLYVDEFEHFPTKEFESVLAEGRRFKFGLVLAHQTLAQLNPKVRSMILNNVGTKFVFRIGREDGAILSKDLTGNADHFDFPSFPRGQAALWRREQPILTVEINEPIVGDVGRQSSEARELLDRTYERAGLIIGSATSAIKTPTVGPAGTTKAGSKPARSEPLASFFEENWLCD